MRETSGSHIDGFCAGKRAGLGGCVGCGAALTGRVALSALKADMLVLTPVTCSSGLKCQTGLLRKKLL